ncbi:MAG TPA: hypothetical protein VKD21_10630 [Acidimicrobiales bacterium]|nr:hypothetical protein [Acidimicrobiales bacterium]
MADRRPAFYAAGGPLGDWWTILHPPYTAWHLSYVAIGAALAPRLDAERLIATLLAFFLAVGVAAHALDELNGRPLRTSVPSGVLAAVAAIALAGAVAIGLVGVTRVGVVLVPFVVVGAFLVAAYNLELLDGRFHTDAMFAAAWGSFPVLTAYVAQAERLGTPALLAAAAAYGLSRAQRSLSSSVRFVRRQTNRVDVTLDLRDGGERRAHEEFLLDPPEAALRTLSWALPVLAAALVVARI